MTNSLLRVSKLCALMSGNDVFGELHLCMCVRAHFDDRAQRQSLFVILFFLLQFSDAAPRKQNFRLDKDGVFS